MQITTAMVKQLRDATGAGIMDAKRALEEAGGDTAKATAIIHQQGLARAEKKTGRTASEGLVWSYIHGGGRIGALVEINCETDFVARTEEFRTLVHDLAMQVAASNPSYVSRDEIPQEELDRGAETFGDVELFVQQAALLSQPFIKEPGRTIEDIVKETAGKLGENIVVRRFARFELGEAAETTTD